jgi:hypothetical protein
MHGRVITGGTLASRKGVNLPARSIWALPVTNKDRADLWELPWLPSDEITGGATFATPSMTMSAETATITTWAPSSSNLPMREGDGMDRHDLVVLGGGAAGITAAKTALALGASVALIDRGPLGGACINRG